MKSVQVDISYHCQTSPTYLLPTPHQPTDPGRADAHCNLLDHHLRRNKNYIIGDIEITPLDRERQNCYGILGVD